jgi:hypothetical protein
VGSVLGVAVPEIVLDDAKVVTLVGQRKAAGVPQGVRMYRVQTGTFGCGEDQVVECLAGERLPTLGDK